MCWLAGTLAIAAHADSAHSPVFPGSRWETRSPEELGLDSAPLDRFAKQVGGDGCIIRDGYLVKSWGEVTRHKDWASAAKPVLSTLLLMAVKEGRLASVDAKVKDLGWDLSDKDAPMTFRHLANMVSGYGLDEPPGAAWGYNDFAIQLYARSLEKVLGGSLDAAFRERMAALKFEDGEFFGSRAGLGVTASVRDFARLGWLWLNRGRWEGRQVLDPELFKECFRVGVPSSTPRCASRANDYLKVGSYGGGTNQTPHGPGVYGFNLWFNEVLGSGQRVWPALPGDASQANGLWNRDTVTVIPSWRMVVACRRAQPGPFEPGRSEGAYNQNLLLLAQALRAAATVQGPSDGPLNGAVHRPPAPLQPIDVSPFKSGIHHWRNLRDASRFITVERDQPSYEPSQVREIIGNILLFQRENGGWPKDYDMTAVLSADQRAKVLATRGKQDTSFDNGNIHSQVGYLARAVAQADEPSWKAACLRGFDFILRAQYENGGFPQRFPAAKGYAAHITFNDGVMIGALNLLRDAAEGLPEFSWLDDRRREAARKAVERGIDCMLRCQIRVDGALTGWCQQHDAHTYEARPARTFELASICPQETTEIVRFLMRQERTTPAISRAIDDAVAWLRKVQLSGTRVEKVKADHASYPGHDTDFDVVVVADTKADPIWARHYEIGTDRPIFAGRDAVKKYVLAEIERERRTGTPWYGAWPRSLLDRDYPRWKAAVDERKARSSRTDSGRRRV